MGRATKQLALFEAGKEKRDPIPILRVYECPRCGDRTESEVALSAIYCPRCKKWYFPDREPKRQGTKST